MLFSFDDFPAFPRRKKIATKKEKCFHFRSSRATHGMVVKNRKLFSYPWLAACVRLGLMQKKLLLSIDCSLFQLPMIQLRDEKKYQIRRPNRKICNLFFSCLQFRSVSYLFIFLRYQKCNAPRNSNFFSLSRTSRSAFSLYPP